MLRNLKNKQFQENSMDYFIISSYKFKRSKEIVALFIKKNSQKIAQDYFFF